MASQGPAQVLWPAGVRPLSIPPLYRPPLSGPTPLLPALACPAGPCPPDLTLNLADSRPTSFWPGSKPRRPRRQVVGRLGPRSEPPEPLLQLMRSMSTSSHFSQKAETSTLTPKTELRDVKWKALGPRERVTLRAGLLEATKECLPLDGRLPSGRLWGAGPGQGPGCGRRLHGWGATLPAAPRCVRPFLQRALQWLQGIDL